VNWFEARNNRKTLACIKKWTAPGKRLLEIGVGSRSFLVAASKAGYEVKGCDLSEPICRQVENNLGIAMHCGPLESLQGKWDVVVMNHVLEHVQQPVGFLETIHHHLIPGGIVHVAVPNITCWEASLSGWTSYEPYHLTYFSCDTLARAAVSAGFTRWEGMDL